MKKVYIFYIISLEHMEISLHMVLMYAKALNDKGVTKIKGMLEEYCHSVMISVSQTINIMDVCHKLTTREFNNHLRGDYYYSDSGDKIMIKTRGKKGMTKNSDSSSSSSSSSNEVNEYKQLIPFECPAPKYVNNERGSLFHMGHLGDKLRGTVSPTSASGNSGNSETVAPTKASN